MISEEVIKHIREVVQNDTVELSSIKGENGKTVKYSIAGHEVEILYSVIENENNYEVKSEGKYHDEEEFFISTSLIKEDEENMDKNFGVEALALVDSHLQTECLINYLAKYYLDKKEIKLISDETNDEVE